MTVSDYLDQVCVKYDNGQATEYSYGGVLTNYSIEKRKRHEKVFSDLIYTNSVDFPFRSDGGRV
ncbi:MAG: hypothetical protein Pars92KO_28290 [Parasphingorhabdus sp.]